MSVIPIERAHQIRKAERQKAGPVVHLSNAVRYPCGATDCAICGEKHVHDFVIDPVDFFDHANPCGVLPIIGRKPND